MEMADQSSVTHSSTPCWTSEWRRSLPVEIDEAFDAEVSSHERVWLTPWVSIRGPFRSRGTWVPMIRTRPVGRVLLARGRF